MAHTIKAIIESALLEITAISEDEQPSAAMIQGGLSALNALISQWSVEGLMVPYMSRSFVAADASKASLTWRPGGDINSAAPVDVAAVNFVFGNLQSPLAKVENTVFMQARWLGNVGEPKWFYYERVQGGGVLHFDVAAYGGGFDMWFEVPIGQYLSLTEEMQLPDFYVRMVISNLAVDLCPGYGKSASPELTYKASSSKSVIERYNATPAPELSISEFTGVGGIPFPLRS